MFQVISKNLKTNSISGKDSSLSFEEGQRLV